MGRVVHHPSGHGGYEIAHRERAAPLDRDDAAVAQHGATIRNRHHLCQLMGNIDDSGSPRLHACKHRKQPFHFAVFQGGRRFVQNKNAAFSGESLGDGDDLALGEAQRCDAAVRIRIKIEPREDGAGSCPHAAAVDESDRTEAAQGRIAERNILRNRQRGDEAQLLRNGYNARRNRVMRTGKIARPPGNENAPAVGTVDAAQNAD